MPGIEDLKDSYDTTGPGPGDSMKGKRGSINAIQDIPKNPGMAMSGQINSGQDASKYPFQLKSGADNDLLRAQNQGFWKTLGLRAANFIPNVLTGTVETVGYAGSLFGEWGKDRDYSNELTRQMQAWHDPFGETYREHPNQTFDFTDSAWWLDNMFQLGESVAQFALPAMGEAKLFEGLAKTASIGRKSFKALSLAGEVATSASLAYAEGAMSGYQIYDQVYKARFDKLRWQGVDDETAHQQAREDASNAAATTVQMNVAMNTLLNMSELAPLFKHSEARVLDYMRQNGKRLAGETAEQFDKRLLQEATESGLFKNRKGLTSYAGVAFQEGLEEVNTQYAEYEGRRQGIDGKKRDLLSALTDFGQALTDVSNQEGMLNFALGSLGGLGNAVAIDHLPVNRVATVDDQGKKTYQFYTGKAIEADRTHAQFKSIADALVHDYGYIDNKLQELHEATLRDDHIGAEKARLDLFDTLAMHSVSTGAGNNLISTFKEMLGTPNTSRHAEYQQQMEALEKQLQQTTDPEEVKAIQQAKFDLIQKINANTSEAMDKGLAMNLQDHSYQQRAQQSIDDIEHYQKLFDNVHAKFNTDEEKEIGVPNYVFAVMAGQYRLNKMVERGNMDLAKLKADHMLAFAGLPANTIEMYNRAAVQFQDTLETHQRRIGRIQGDLNQLRAALEKGDDGMVNKILDKYRLLGYTGENLSAKLIERMQDMINNSNEAIKDAHASLERDTGYAKWKEKHPDGKLDEYGQELTKKFGSSAAIKDMEGQLMTMQQIAENNNARVHDLLHDSDSIKAVQRKLIKNIKDQHAMLEEETKSKAVEKELQAAAERAHVEGNINALSDQERTHLTELHEHMQAEGVARAGMQKAQEDLNKLNVTSHKAWNVPWQAKHALANRELSKHSKNLAVAQQRQEEIRAKLDEIRTAKMDQGTPAVAPVAAQERAQPEQTQPVDNGTTDQSTEPSTEAAQPAAPVVESPATGPGVVANETGGQAPAAPLTTDSERKAMKYLTQLDRLPAEVIKAFEQVETALKSGLPLDMDAFFRRGDIVEALEQNLVARFLLKRSLELLKDYVDSLPKTERPVDTSAPAEEQVEQEQAQPEETVIQPVAMIPSEPPTRNATDIEVEGDYREHVGKKRISALTMANNTLETTDYTDNKGNYRIAGRDLNPNTDPDVTDPKKLLAGTKVTLEVDTSYDGLTWDPTTPNTKIKVTYADFADEKGNVTDIDNVPIRILGPDGKVKGYVPTIDFLTRRFPGATGPEGFRNIVAVHTIPDGNGGTIEVDNLTKQINILRSLRNRIVKNGKIETTLGEKGAGTVIRNVTDQGDGTFYPTRGIAVSKSKPATSLLPDYKNLKLVIIQDGLAYTSFGRDVPVANNPAELKQRHNTPAVLLPGANGQGIAEPLYMPMINSHLDFSSIERAITLYLSQDQNKEEIAAFFKESGLNLRNSKDLRKYINRQFTYMESFDASHTALNAKVSPKFLFNVTEPTDKLASIMVGWSASGQRPEFASLANGELSENFKNILRNGLVTRFRNVNFDDGINTSGEFTEHYYSVDPRTKKGSWKTRKFSNYNEYILTNAETYAYGRNQIGDRYVYTANPSIPFGEELKPATDPGPVTVTSLKEEGPASATVPARVDINSADAADLLDSMGHFYPGTASTTSYIEPSENMRPLSIDVLQELSNFTPPGKHNGLSVDDAMKQLLRNGIGYLAEGYNPFIKC